MGPAQGSIYVMTKKTLSRHNSQSLQQRATELCHDKDYFYHDKQNKVQVNSAVTRKSLSQQEVEEQSRERATKEVMLRHSEELKVESLLQ